MRAITDIGSKISTRSRKKNGPEHQGHLYFKERTSA
jgi:hypothetical protein